MKASDLKATESQHQCAVIEWARLQETFWPVLRLLHSIPNGGGRGKPFKNKRARAAEAAGFKADKKDVLPPLLAVKLKAEGLTSGIPDLHIPAARGGFIGMYIEMKTKDGELSDAQKKIIPLLEAERNMVVVCYDATQAISAIRSYIAQPQTVR